MTYPQHLPVQRVSPGTAEKPLVTEGGMVIVRGICIEQVQQLRHNKRWVVIRLEDGRVSDESWQYQEQAIDALRERYAGGQS